MSKRSRQKRVADFKIVNHLYKNKFRWSKQCVYCGQAEQTKDHVLPIGVAAGLDFNHPRLRRNTGQGLNRVPCCIECNSLASNKAFFSIREKRKYIQKKLRIRHRKWLRHVLWDEDELSEMGRTMQDQIKQAMHNRQISELRVNWPAHSYTSDKTLN